MSLASVANQRHEWSGAFSLSSRHGAQPGGIEPPLTHMAQKKAVIGRRLEKKAPPMPLRTGTRSARAMPYGEG